MSARPLEIPTGQEIYDRIMGEIEPDLTSEGRKTLPEKYKTETPQERALRKVRYERALERYDQAYGGYLRTLKTQVERERKGLFQAVEQDDRKKEAVWMKNFPSLLRAA